MLRGIHTKPKNLRKKLGNSYLGGVESSDTRHSHKCITFHNFFKCVFCYRFPTDPVIRKQWAVALMRKNFIPSGHSRLCSKHFTEGSYQIRPNRILKLLKPNAVPTLFDFPEHLKVENSTTITEVSIYHYSTNITTNSSLQVTL